MVVLCGLVRQRVVIKTALWHSRASVIYMQRTGQQINQAGFSISS